MATIWTTCPETFRLITSGIDTDERTIRNAGQVMIAIFCEHCRDYHHIKTDDVFLIPTEGSGRPDDDRR